MLISSGKVHASEPWRILEVSIGQSPDILALRISKELKRLRENCEALIPMQRNQDGEAEWIIEHIYVRGLNGSLSKLARTPGIDYVRDELAPSEWIMELLRREQMMVKSQLKLNDFVRVLTGPCARLCGEITKLREPKVTVLIQLPTKKVRVYTTVQNIQPIDCPADKRSFFYQSDLS